MAVPCAIYYASYYFYGTARGLGGGVGMFFTEDYAKVVWDNQVYMWEYHSDLVAEHPYSSRWYQWLVDARPYSTTWCALTTAPRAPSGPL